MAEHHGQFRVTSMCRVLRVQRSGYYAWKATPKSLRAQADEALTTAIQQSFEDSDGIYGSPRIHRDLREAGVLCGKKRVARLMQAAKLRSVRGYKRPRYRAGKPGVAAPNRLQRQFTVGQPDQVWVTDITYIRTYEGWLYLAVVIDLRALLNLGYQRLLAGDFADALRLTHAAQRLDPTYALAYENEANIYLQQGDAPAALKLLAGLEKRFPAQASKYRDLQARVRAAM